MKWVIWALVIINCAFLGFFQVSRIVKEQAEDTETSVEAPTKTANDNPIKILSDAEVAVLPKRDPEPSPVVAAPTCFEWGSFAAADASRAQAALKKLGLSATSKPVEKASAEKTRYWVYIPPLKTMELAQAKNDELKGLGVEETLIIQEPKLRFAISLGLFKDEKLANEFIAKLRDMGVKGAVKAKRGQSAKEVSLMINNVSSEQAQKLNELKPHFSHGELSAADCK